MKTPANQFAIVVSPLPDARDPQGYRRLRLGVRALLRRFRLRCIDMHAVEAFDPDGAPNAEPAFVAFEREREAAEGEVDVAF
jgi:hypothetical protein